MIVFSFFALTVLGLPEATRDAILARRFYASLKTLIPHLLHLDEVAAVDQELQKAASQFCTGEEKIMLAFGLLLIIKGLTLC